MSVAVFQKDGQEDDEDKFLETEPSKFRSMTGTSSIDEHSITMKDNKPIKQRYHPKNPKIHGNINAMVDELLEKGLLEHSRNP